MNLRNARSHGTLAIAIAVFALATLAASAGTAQPSAGSSSTSAVQSPLQSPVSSPLAPASPAIKTAEVLAVAERIFPGPHPAGCDWRDRSICPVTDRLAARMEQLAQPPKG
jgi:hypothetical protein